MNLGEVKKISTFIREVKASFIDVGALSPRTASPIAKRNELIEDIWEGFGLFGDGDGPFFGVTTECLMKLVEIFSTPMRVRECSLKASNVLLHFPFPMDRLEDAPFSIDLVTELKALGIVGMIFLRKMLSPFVVQAVDFSKRELVV